VLGAPASLIGSELPGLSGSGLYTVPLAALVRPIALCAAFTLAWLCLAGGLGWCDHETIEALVGSGPHPPARVLLMYTKATSLPNLYIRNIIPDDMGIPASATFLANRGGELVRIVYCVWHTP